MKDIDKSSWGGPSTNFERLNKFGKLKEGEAVFSGEWAAERRERRPSLLIDFSDWLPRGGA